MAGSNDKGMGISEGTRYAFGGQSGPVYDVSDADANHLMFDMEPADGTHVPVVMAGIDIMGVDLALFNGVTFPSWGVVDNDRDSAVGLAFTADDVAELVLYGNATELRLPASAVLDGSRLTSPILTTPEINDASDDHQYVFAVSELAADRTVTLPQLTAGDTFVFEAHAQTLTNKTIDADNNTVSNLAHGAEVDNPSSGVHGVTGSVVGTTDVQTLTNKTLTTPTIGSFVNAQHDHANAAGGGALFASAVKASDTTRNSTTTLTADPDLSVAVDADSTYEFELFVHVVSGTTPDWKHQMTVPSGATIVAQEGFIGTAGTLQTAVHTGSASGARLTSGNDDVLNMKGVVIVAGTSGNLTLTWAQNTSDAADTTAKAGSWIRIRKVS